MALGLGYGLPFAVKRPVQGFAEDVTLATNNALADAAQREEAGNCLTARAMQIMQTVQTQPSLLIVPQLYKAGVLYDQLPTTRTNFLPNNSMAGATGSVLPTTWSSGSIPAGFTFSVGASGQATANDGTLVNYVDVSVSGTATASGTFNLFFSAATGAVTATTGQTYTLSAYATCISGDITTPAMVLQVQEVSGSTFQAGTSTNIALASGAVLQRLSAVRTFNQSGVTASRGRIGHPIVSGTTYSYTIRIASPQLERLGVATPVIATSTGAVTRLNESTNVVGLPPDFTVSRNTTAMRVDSSGLIESVASGVPRIDWLGQSCPALLVEASASNGILNSTDTTTNWTCWSGFTSGVIDVLGVSGVNLQVNTSGSNIGAGTGNGNIARTNNNVALASGSTYTLSFFIKKTGAHTIGGYYASITGAASGDLGGGFNVSGSFSSGSIYNTAGTTNRIRRVEQWGTDVYRCSETFTMTASGTLTTFRLAPVSGVTLASLAAVGTELGFAAPQIELSSVPTTFIPTTTAAVSRAADVISASGALVSGLIGQTEGTVYVEVDLRNLNTGVFRRILAISDGTTSNVFQIFTSDSSSIVNLASTASGFTTLSSPTTIIGVAKIAFAYALNDVAFYINGNLIGTRTPSTIPACNTISLGSRVDSSNFLNDRIRAAALYNTRLTNAQLAALTTP
jgi:hypothetical protein